MKLSKKTIELIKNFSTINQSIVIEAGNQLSTMAVTKNIVGVSEIDETFPRNICIYDLGQFLSTLSLFESPELDLGEEDDTFFTIKGDGNVIRFYMTDESFVTKGKEVKMPDADVDIDLTEEVLGNAIKAATVMNLPELVIESDGEVIKIVAKDSANGSANTYSYEVGKGDGSEYSFVFATGNLKIMPGTYNLKISKHKISQFTHSNGKLKYWIALDASSTYTE